MQGLRLILSFALFLTLFVNFSSGNVLNIYYWDASNPVFNASQVTNETANACCCTPNDTAYFLCYAINQGDTVQWWTQKSDPVIYTIQATDPTWTTPVLTYQNRYLDPTLRGEEAFGQGEGIAYTLYDAGIFYWRDATNTTMRGAIVVYNYTAPSTESTYDKNINTYNDVLGWITLVLLCLSIVGALLTILTFTLFASIRTYPIKLIMYLCVVIVIGNLWFILAFENTFLDNGALCFVTGMIVHGFFLSNFCWTFCIAFNFYQMIVRRNRESEALEKWYHLFAWGFPVFCMIFVTCFLEYGNTGTACYVTSALYIFIFFFLPGLVIISSNAILFFFVAREIHETLASAPKTDKRERKKEMRVYISIFISIGLSWIFGFIMVLIPEKIIQLIFLTLFSISQPLQGFLIFVSYCINAKVAGKYAGLFGKCIPFCRRWENLDSRSGTSSGRTASSSGRSSRSARSSGRSSSRSADTQDLSLDSTNSAASKTELYGADEDEEEEIEHGKDNNDNNDNDNDNENNHNKEKSDDDDVEAHHGGDDGDGIRDDKESGGGINFGNDDL